MPLVPAVAGPETLRGPGRARTEAPTGLTYRVSVFDPAEIRFAGAIAHCSASVCPQSSKASRDRVEGAGFLVWRIVDNGRLPALRGLSGPCLT